MPATPTAPARPLPEPVTVGDQSQLTDLLRHARDVRLDQLEAIAVRDSDLGAAVLDEIDFRVAAQVYDELSEIEAALRRVSLGTYGTCERCERAIPVARLYARPHARFCVPCQSRRR